MKKSNGKLVWPALFLILIACPGLAMLNFDYLGYAALLTGILIIAYALATGQLKLFG